MSVIFLTPQRRYPQNCSHVPIVPVYPRDPRCWTKDDAVKAAKAAVSNSQHAINNVLKIYEKALPNLHANIHLKIGRQRV